MKKVIVILFVLLSSNLLAQTPANSKQEYCHNYYNKDYFKNMLRESSNRISFVNHGGLLNAGVCWWHSRFQRAATYLTTYRPELPKPTYKEAKKLIRSIRKRRSVVIIPGYQNLNEFSSAWPQLIQKTLERWQIIDGFIFQSWIIGLSGKTKTTAQKMKDKMDQLYIDVMIHKNISYQMLQLAGIDAHAWLVLEMTPITGGYNLLIVDSNYLNLQTYTYKFNDTNLYYRYTTEFVPYLQKKRELKRIFRRMQKYCSSY